MIDQPQRKRGRPRKVIPLLPTTTLTEYVEESIAFLQEHEPKEGYFVGFSGGKDSIVTLELCKMAGIKYEAFFSCTRIDPPQLYSFIRQHYPEVTWLFPKETFWDGIRRAGPPMRLRRWCCDSLKKDPAKDIPLKHRVMGIRAEESVSRAKRPRISEYESGAARGVITYKPIFYWPEWAVWEFISDRVLPYPTLYDEGFGRLGCVICPYILNNSPGANKQKELSRMNWPALWGLFEKAIKSWWVEKQHRKENEYHIDADDYYQDYINGFTYER